MVEYLPPLPATRTVSQEWSIKYVKSLSGILKIVEVVLALAVFICACQLKKDMAWVDLVSLSGMIQAGVFFVVHILNFFPNMLLAFIIELIVYAVFTVLFLTAEINCAVVAADIKPDVDNCWYLQRTVHARFEEVCRDYERAFALAIAATVFCLLCLIVWAVETVLMGITMNKRRTQPPPPTGAAATSATYPS